MPYVEKQAVMYVCPNGTRSTGTAPPTSLGTLALTRHPGATITIDVQPGPHCRAKNGTFGAGTFELLFEYDGNGGDWDDTVMRFDSLGDGKWRITSTENDRGPNPTPETQAQGSFSSSFRDLGGEPVLTVGQGQMPGATAEFRVGVDSAHYGMNNRAERMTGDSHRILVVEYLKPVADVVGVDARDIWMQQVAPRHSGAERALRRRPRGYAAPPGHRPHGDRHPRGTVAADHGYPPVKSYSCSRSHAPRGNALAGRSASL